MASIGGILAHGSPASQDPRREAASLSNFMPDSKPPSKPATLVFSLLGAGIGIAVTEYTGIVIGLPVAVALILWFVFTKTRLSPKTFQLSIGVLGGQAALFLLIALTGSIGAWKLAVPDLALLIAGIAWLWARPGLPPVIALAEWTATNSSRIVAAQSEYDTRIQARRGGLAV